MGTDESSRRTLAGEGLRPLRPEGPSMAEWVEKASVELLGSRTHEGVWGYRKDLGPCAEATALACLGLLGCERWANHDSWALAVARGAEWLTILQNAGGSLAVSPRLSEPGW